VTALSIIFFFAVRHFLNRIEELGASPIKTIESRIAKLGGFVISDVNLKIQTPEAEKSARIVESQFMQALNRKVDAYRGESIFAVNVQEISKDIEKLAWVQSVEVNRKFPHSLLVQVKARVPFFVLHGTVEWVLADKNGIFISSSKFLNGTWVDLPKVFGMEEQLLGEPDELNRRLFQERAWLKDLANLILTMKSKVLVSVDEEKIKKDQWLNEAVFNLNWTKQKEGKLKRYHTKFLSHHWKSRIRSLQFVLSDLSSRDFDEVNISGQYSGRWIVQMDPKGKERRGS